MPAPRVYTTNAQFQSENRDGTGDTYQGAGPYPPPPPTPTPPPPAVSARGARVNGEAAQ